MERARPERLLYMMTSGVSSPGGPLGGKTPLGIYTNLFITPLIEIKFTTHIGPQGEEFL